MTEKKQEIEKIETDSQLLRKSFEKSMKIFEDILDGKRETTQSQLDVALTVTRAYVKSRAVENQKALLVYQVAKDFSKDKNELRNILRASISNVKFLGDSKDQI